MSSQKEKKPSEPTDRDTAGVLNVSQNQQSVSQVLSSEAIRPGTKCSEVSDLCASSAYGVMYSLFRVYEDD